jgi:urease accessory protein
MSTAWPCQRRRFRPDCVILLLLLSSAPVFAHTGDTGGGFTSGFSHPIGGLDHVLAMVAVGVWGAQLGHPQVWLLPMTFPLMMACGAALGLMGYPFPMVEVGIACSAIALGLMVLLEAQPPHLVSLALVAFFALFHGHAHGTELPVGQNRLLYSFGVVISTGLLHAVGIGIGTLHRWQVGRVILRTAGAGVLGGGLFFLGRSIGWLS